jgi:hypothetical protein
MVTLTPLAAVLGSEVDSHPVFRYPDVDMRTGQIMFPFYRSLQALPPSRHVTSCLVRLFVFGGSV